MASRHCHVCNTDWPDEWPAFKSCPAALGDNPAHPPQETVRKPMGTPVEDPASTVKHLKFERYYAERQAQADREFEALIDQIKDAPQEPAGEPTGGSVWAPGEENT